MDDAAEEGAEDLGIERLAFRELGPGAGRHQLDEPGGARDRHRAEPAEGGHLQAERAVLGHGPGLLRPAVEQELLQGHQHILAVDGQAGGRTRPSIAAAFSGRGRTELTATFATGTTSSSASLPSMASLRAGSCASKALRPAWTIAGRFAP